MNNQKRKVFLITGFNNWGKSTLINDLFQGKRFSRTEPQELNSSGVKFMVQSQSNDDLRHERYIEQVIARSKGGNYLVAAFCPSMESLNDSKVIISSAAFSCFSEIHVLLLKYKWDLHAELCIESVSKYLRISPAIRMVTVESGVINERVDFVRKYLVHNCK
jgi:hypothetical protein